MYNEAKQFIMLLKNKYFINLRTKFLISFGIFCFVLFTFTISFLNLDAQASTPPQVINYQGKLLENGNVVSTTKQMVFVLFTSSTAGTELYTSGSISVTPTSGIFSVNLGAGSTNSLDPEIFKNNQDVYLEVRVGAETLTPRKQVTAVPYSFNSKYLDGVSASSTSPASVHIPLSDSSGNFSFNKISVNSNSANTEAILTIGNTAGNIEWFRVDASPEGSIIGSIGDIAVDSTNGKMYIKETGISTSTGWSRIQSNITQIKKTTASHAGDFATSTLVGYQAANNICSSEFAGSHFCRTDEIIGFIAENNIDNFSNFGWIAEGPPGYTSNSNDCSGWTSGATDQLGAYWAYNSSGGGKGWLVNCETEMPISCCK